MLTVRYTNANHATVSSTSVVLFLRSLWGSVIQVIHVVYFLALSELYTEHQTCIQQLNLKVCSVYTCTHARTHAHTHARTHTHHTSNQYEKKRA